MTRRHLADCFGRALSSQIKAFKSVSNQIKGVLPGRSRTRDRPGPDPRQARYKTDFVTGCSGLHGYVSKELGPRTTRTSTMKAGTVE
jgi:hypothetical protein